MRRITRLASMFLLLAIVPGLHAQSLQEVRALVDARAAGAPAAAEALARKSAGDAEVWVLLTRARLQSRQPEKAIAAARKATQLAPDNAQAFYWLGNAYGNRIGQVNMLSKLALAPKLRDAFEGAVRLDPALLDARSSLAEFYLLAPAAIGGGVDKARAQAVAIGRYDRARGLLVQGRIATHQKNPGQALKVYQQAHALKPRDAQVRIALIVAYQDSARWKEAFEATKQWTVEEPGKAAAWYQLGRIAAESGQFLGEGEAALRKYLTLAREPGSPEPQHARYRLGQVLGHAGRKQEARVELQAALKIDPGFKAASEALSKL